MNYSFRFLDTESEVSDVGFADVILTLGTPDVLDTWRCVGTCWVWSITFFWFIYGFCQCFICHSTAVWRSMCTSIQNLTNIREFFSKMIFTTFNILGLLTNIFGTNGHMYNICSIGEDFFVLRVIFWLLQ